MNIYNIYIIYISIIVWLRCNPSIYTGLYHCGLLSDTNLVNLAGDHHPMVVVAGTMAGGTQVIDGFHGWSEGTMETRNGNLSSKHDSVDGTRFQTWHSQVWWNYHELSKHLVTIPLEKTHGYMTSTNFGEMYNFHGERKDYQINYQMVRKKWMGWCSPCDTYPNILHIPENFLEILPGFFHPSKRSEKKNNDVQLILILPRMLPTVYLFLVNI